jgi:adenosylmethionine-8-amino-7-oxononanoate aminotransferase
MAKGIDKTVYTGNSRSMETASLAERDASCIWHPFTQAGIEKIHQPIVKGCGSYLYDPDGKGYLDAISSWWVNLHGHGHPYIAQSIAKQAYELEHVLFAGYTHPQAVRFAERLLKLFSGAYSHLFYSDNGSTAVEVALKMAFQKEGTGKTVVALQGAYHGDTFGAMAAAGTSPYHKPFWPYFFKVHSVEAPIVGAEDASWNQFLKVIDSEPIAAFIFEPLVQGASGMRMLSQELLGQMTVACQTRGIAVIADEVMTGFGRTGPLFASLNLPSAPDYICLSKGITGGFLPMGATLVKRPVYESFLSNEADKAFLHGHSYTANPIACAAANASLDLLLDSGCTEARERIAQEHGKFCNEFERHPHVKRCETLGTILALEYNQLPIDRLSMIRFFQNEGIIVRPLGNVLYLLPPYCMDSVELHTIYKSIRKTLEW